MLVMLVDDHEVVRLGYASLLRTQSFFEVQADCASTDEAYHWLLEAHTRATLPEVLITDLSLGGASGLELIAKVKERFAQIKIIALSMHESGALIQRCFDLGAEGYFCKSNKPSLLKQAIETVMAGRPYIDETAQQALDSYAQGKQKFAALTRREFEVLQQVIRGENYLNIAQSLHLSVKTIANHLSSIRGKLGVETDFQLIRLVDELGLPSKDSQFKTPNA